MKADVHLSLKPYLVHHVDTYETTEEDFLTMLREARESQFLAWDEERTIINFKDKTYPVNYGSVMA